MEGRCCVETWTEFGFLGTWSKITHGFGSDVFLLTGTDEVCVFSIKEKKVTTVLQFPAPVTDLVLTPDQEFLYVSCNSGVFCFSRSFLISRTQRGRAEESSDPDVLQITSEFLTVEEEGVLSLLLVKSVLLVLSCRDESWIWSLYKSTREAYSSRFERTGSLTLPMVSAAVLRDTEMNTRLRRRPVLICLLSSSTSSSVETLSHGHFLIESVLFKLLFGIDTALAKSPVILCGLPDGRLCFFPLHLPVSRLRILHSLQQPVVFIGASDFTEASAGHAQCLVAVGGEGRILVMKTDKGESEGGDRTVGFVERCVAAPVVCGFVDKQHLYYSTGSDLMVLELSQGSTVRGEQERADETWRRSADPAAVLHTPISLNVCRITTLAAAVDNTAGVVELLGLSTRGQLLKITLPVRNKDAETSSVPSLQVGHSVRDLLSSIGDVYDRVSALKGAIKSKNKILQYLNQVLNISFLLRERANGDGQLSKQIRCRAETRWTRLLQKDFVILTCVLENLSPYSLEKGWSLSLTVSPLSHSPSVSGEQSTRNYSFSFHNLRPGGTFDVSLPLADAGDSSFPVQISCSLIFLLSSLLEEDDMVKVPSLQNTCFSLPLNGLTVDWLHVLQVDTHQVHRNSTFHSLNNSTNTIRAFLGSLRTKGFGQLEAGGDDPSKSEREQFSARIRVSSQLLKDTLGSSLDHQGPSLNLCLSLINWLMSDGPAGGKTGHVGDKMDRSSSVVQAQGPNGERVRLTATEIGVGDKLESVSAVEVQVDSSSLTAVCGLHHAVLQRLQALMRSAPESAPNRTLQTLGVRAALQRAERLLQQVQQSRLSRALGEDISLGQQTRCLLSVYRELRENPLVIL